MRYTWLKIYRASTPKHDSPNIHLVNIRYSLSVLISVNSNIQFKIKSFIRLLSQQLENRMGILWVLEASYDLTLWLSCISMINYHWLRVSNKQCHCSQVHVFCLIQPKDLHHCLCELYPSVSLLCFWHICLYILCINIFSIHVGSSGNWSCMKENSS